MQIETLPEVHSTDGPRSELYDFSALEQPNNIVPDLFRPIKFEGDSLATYVVGDLQWNLGKDLQTGSAAIEATLKFGNLEWALGEYLQGIGFDRLQPRLLIDTNFLIVRESERRTSTRSDLQGRLVDKLKVAFDAEPLEDGMDHPAEEIIGQAIKSREDVRVLDWLMEFSLDVAQPNFAASVLRCLGRQVYPGTESWRTNLVSSALDMNDAEIRDAAVQAAEFWGGKGIRNVLEVHQEPLPWLREYVRGVVEDLRD